MRSDPLRGMKVIYAFPEPLPIARARGIQTAHTVASLAKLGVYVDLYHSPGPGHPIRGYGLEPPATLRTIPVSRSLPWPLSRVHSNRFFAARLLRAIRRDVGGDLRSSLVMVRHLKLAALMLERVPDIRLVYEAHEVFADTAPADKVEERRAEEARVMRSASAIVCNSHATAERLCKLYGSARKMEVIPNGVEWPQDLPPKDWEHLERHVVYAGSLFPWKGAADLVTAAAALTGCRIELIGGEAERVRKLAETAPLRGAELLLTGQVPHEVVLERLAAGCIAVLPNRADADSAFTSPIKLFEYMAAGCAIVATDLPAIREILDEGDAAWAAPGDPSSLAEAISGLVANPARARALAGRVREKARQYTWSARAGRLQGLFQDLGAVIA
jgi:glycosyltransferase involved in cell wall biosynthesis